MLAGIEEGCELENIHIHIKYIDCTHATDVI